MFPFVLVYCSLSLSHSVCVSLLSVPVCVHTCVCVWSGVSLCRELWTVCVCVGGSVLYLCSFLWFLCVFCLCSVILPSYLTPINHVHLSHPSLSLSVCLSVFSHPSLHTHVCAHRLSLSLSHSHTPLFFLLSFILFLVSSILVSLCTYVWAWCLGGPIFFLLVFCAYVGWYGESLIDTSYIVYCPSFRFYCFPYYFNYYFYFSYISG